MTTLQTPDLQTNVVAFLPHRNRPVAADLLASTAIPQRRKAYSIIRFSTPQQALGDSLRRQLEATEKYCRDHNLELVESIRDEGRSGYHGTHRKKGAFGRFVKRFMAGEIPPDAVFICEGFDRFTREPVRIAQQLFLTLINGGMDVHMLILDMTFTAASIDKNVGELYMAIGMMVGAHGESHTKAGREREAWITRRNGGIGKETGLPSNIFPAWIVKTPNGPKLDTAKAKTLHRIREMLPTMGLEQIAKKLNDEGTPPLNTRKRQRGVALWDKAMLGKLIRGRQVLGEQEIGRYQDVKDVKTGEITFKRVLTGEVKKDAYPAVFTEDERRVANHHLDARRRGVQTGRNVSGYTNLFGMLAHCGVCQGRMKIRGKGRLGSFKYLGCSNAGLHKKRTAGKPAGKATPVCDNTRYFRLDRIEAAILPKIADWLPEDDDRPQNDPGKALNDQIAKLKADAARIEQAYERAMFDSGALAVKTAAKLSADHAAKLSEKQKLEREIAAHAAARPASELQQVVGRAHRSALGGHIPARKKVAAALPGLIRHIICRADGTLNVGFMQGGFTKPTRLVI